VGKKLFSSGGRRAGQKRVGDSTLHSAKESGVGIGEKKRRVRSRDTSLFFAGGEVGGLVAKKGSVAEHISNDHRRTYLWGGLNGVV